MKISVLGAGGWGTTLAILLHGNGHDITLWEYKPNYAEVLKQTRINNVYLPHSKIPDEILITCSLDEAVTDQHFIVIAVPTQFIRGVLNSIHPLHIEETIFVSCSKGIENNSLLTISGVIKDVFTSISDSQIGVLSGPSHSEELSNKTPTAVVAASLNEEVSKLIQRVFITDYFRVYSSTDVIGVELGGALKNIIAIGAGIIDGAEFGDNTKAAIITRGLAEIARFGIELGAKPETFTGLSGMGDLIVTCGSRHSRNRYVGGQIGKGKKLKEVIESMEMVAEGVETCRSGYKLARKHNAETPIIDAIHSILFEDKDPVKVTYDLMTREMKSEH